MTVNLTGARIAKRQPFGQSLREFLDWATEVENPTLTVGSPILWDVFLD